MTKRCRVKVLELGIYVWAFLHEDTVCVLSLGLLVNRGGFSYFWKPGKFPELVLGKRRISCHPHFNVPFIYSSQARGDLSAYPSVTSSGKSQSTASLKVDQIQARGDLMACPATDRWTMVPATADAPDDDDEDDLDDSPDLIPADSEEEVPVPTNPVPKRSRG